jgi:hypothetical protein
LEEKKELPVEEKKELPLEEKKEGGRRFSGSGHRFPRFHVSSMRG